MLVRNCLALVIAAQVAITRSKTIRNQGLADRFSISFSIPEGQRNRHS
jgi:hypothetical protein